VSKRTKFLLGIGVIAALVVGFQVAAYAANLSGSTFEIDTDANLIVNGTGIDWLTGGTGTGFRTGVLAKNDTASGAGDESFGQGTAEDNPNPTIVDGSIPPNKSDLKAFGVFTENDEFLELFWSRVQNPSGTTNMDFELNQEFCDGTATHCANNGSARQPLFVTPKRTDGDVLVTYDLSKGGTIPGISIRFWDGPNSEWGPANLISDGASPDALGSVNTSLIPANQTGGVSGGLTTALGTQDPFTFGEAAISFDALFGEGACGEFGSAYLKSRSSDSFTSEIKDFVPPEAVTIGNCDTEISTDATNNAGDNEPAATVGSTIRDSANLDQVADPNLLGADGSIEFQLFGPYAQGEAITCAAGKLVTTYGTNGTATVPVVDHAVGETGDTSNPYLSPTFTTTAPGTYQWVATFKPTAGQGLNESATTCPDLDEQSVVANATSGIITAQKWLPQDSATVTAPAGTTGTVVFTLYENGTCTPPTTGTPVTFTDNSAPYETNNAVYRTASTTISWKATFTPTAGQGVDPSTSGCEVSNLTITN
jgi:hypothetical protein